MCGIAGIIHRGSSSNIGGEMTSMLQSMKHRGPDSSGYAVYGSHVPGELVLRFKVAEQEDMGHGFEIHDEVKKRRAEVDCQDPLARRGDRIALKRPRNTLSATASNIAATCAALPTTSKM